MSFLVQCVVFEIERFEVFIFLFNAEVTVGGAVNEQLGVSAASLESNNTAKVCYKFTVYIPFQITLGILRVRGTRRHGVLLRETQKLATYVFKKQQPFSQQRIFLT